MLSAEEIKTLIAGGEGYNVDFKLRVPAKINPMFFRVLFMCEKALIPKKIITSEEIRSFFQRANKIFF